MRSRWLLSLTCLGLLACEAHLANGLGRAPDETPAPPQPFRAGCRLNVATHAATCPCATVDDLDQLPDRPDLETLDAEIDDEADPSGLNRLTHLRGLTLHDATQEKLQRVTLLYRLDSLTVYARADLDLSPLAAMKNLHSIEISLGGTHGVCDVTPLAELPKLEKIVLALRCDHEIDVTPLAGLPVLHEVTLFGNFPSNDVATKLPNAKVAVHGPDGSLCDIDPSACPAVSRCK